MNYYLGLDMGTTGVKAAVFDVHGNMPGSALVEYTLETPAPDIVELDPEIYWLSAARAIAQAVGSAGINPAEIKALSVTGHIRINYIKYIGILNSLQYLVFIISTCRCFKTISI